MGSRTGLNLDYVSLAELEGARWAGVIGVATFNGTRLAHGPSGQGADRPEKWVFSRITARSFLWCASVLVDDGVTWRTTTEFQLHRTA